MEGDGEKAVLVTAAVSGLGLIAASHHRSFFLFFLSQRMSELSIAHAIREFLVGSLGGFAYGLTAAALSHPLDTIKVRQQAHAGYLSKSAAQTARGIWRSEGIPGFYRGFVPALAGSIVFRAIPFAAYSATNQLLIDRGCLAEEPVARAFVSGASGGFLRSFVECPVEVMKTRRQVTNPWELRSLANGIGITVLRNTAVIGAFWAVLVATQPYREAISPTSEISSFLAGGGCSVVAWALVFPLDVVKSRVQSGGAYQTAEATGKIRYSPQSLGIVKCTNEILHEQGVRGLYAGFQAGMARTIVANGLAMVVYDHIQRALG